VEGLAAFLLYFIFEVVIYFLGYLTLKIITFGSFPQDDEDALRFMILIYFVGGVVVVAIMVGFTELVAYYIHSRMDIG